MYAENKRGFHGHRIRPDRHRTDAGKGSLPEAHEDQGYRRAVPAVRGIRPDREGRGGFVRRDREASRVEDPVDPGREGHENALARTAGLWRIDFFGDHNAIVRLFVIDVRTLPRSAWFASRLFRA